MLQLRSAELQARHLCPTPLIGHTFQTQLFLVTWFNEFALFSIPHVNSNCIGDCKPNALERKFSWSGACVGVAVEILLFWFVSLPGGRG